MKKLTVTIGIPAFNEEKNIGGLIKDLLNQHLKTVVIDKIIIVSDGSTDNTVSIAKQFKNRQIILREGDKRKGKAARQNEMIAMSSSDILILLDADIVIQDKAFLEKLIKPIVAGDAEMTSSSIKPLPSRGFFEKILFVSSMLKQILYMEFKNGNNIYTCYGPARAFARKFYQKLHFPISEGEDMFSYFSCLNFGYKFKDIPRAITYYRLPIGLSDHLKQSTRYHRARKHMNQYFDSKMVLNEQIIPLYIYLIAFLKAFPIILKHPIHVVLYLLIFGYTKIISKTKFQKNDSWNVTTSKFVRSQI